MPGLRGYRSISAAEAQPVGEPQLLGLPMALRSSSR